MNNEEKEKEEKEFIVKTSPIKFTVEKNGIEYEFEPIGEITDLVKLKLDIVNIMKSFNITIRSKHIVVIQKKSVINKSFEENYLRSKEVIREWYKEDPNREWSANELMEAAKLEKSKRSSIMTKLMREKFIRCINLETSKNLRRYVKAEAMIAPEAIEKRDMKKLIEERKLIKEG